MGGRGGSGGDSTRSAEYRNAYNIEIENAKNFPASFAVESGATKDTTSEREREAIRQCMAELRQM